MQIPGGPSMRRRMDGAEGVAEAEGFDGSTPVFPLWAFFLSPPVRIALIGATRR